MADQEEESQQEKRRKERQRQNKPRIRQNKPRQHQNKPRIRQNKPRQRQNKPRLSKKKRLPKWEPVISHKKEYRVIARPRKGGTKAKVSSRLDFFFMDNMPKYRNFSNINGSGKRRRNYHAVVTAESVIARLTLKLPGEGQMAYL